MILIINDTSWKEPDPALLEGGREGHQEVGDGEEGR